MNKDCTEQRKHVHTGWHLDTLTQVFQLPDSRYEVTLTHNVHGPIFKCLIGDSDDECRNESLLREIAESLQPCVSAIHKHKQLRAKRSTATQSGIQN